MNAARADSLDKAIETVKSASDEDLRKEIERRLPKKKNSAATTRSVVAAPRSAAPGLTRSTKRRPASPRSMTRTF